MNIIKSILVTLVLIASISVASAGDVGGYITEDETWGLAGSPYNVTGNVKVWYATLTINPGVTVNFSDGKYLWIKANGKLLAEGTPDDKITFTGTEKTAGHWKGIIFGPLSDDESVIDNAIIEYGGYACECDCLDARYANIMLWKAAPTITNSTIRNSVGDGILCIGSSSTPTITCNWITNNTNGVHTVLRAQPAINYNNICGNSEYGVLHSAKWWHYPPTVDATHNWWGANDGPSGAGTGTGDAVSDKVDYSDWTGSPVPCAPIPELSSIILVAVGIMMLAGYVRIGRRD